MSASRLQEVTYVHRYYDFLSPLRIATAVLQAGRVPPRMSSEFHYLDIGCGFADTLLIHAAMYPQGRFYGIDFNPAHVAMAQRIAEEAGLDNVQIIEASFEEINEGRLDVPSFDFIVCNGVISHLNPQHVQQVLTAFDSKLRSGGAALLGYNAAPRQSALVGVTHFLRQIYQTGGGNNAQRVQKALQAWKVAIDNKVGSLSGEAMENMQKQMAQSDPRLIAHDFMAGEEWRPYYASELHDLVYQGARLEYIGLVDPESYFIDGALPQEVRSVLAEAPDASVRSQILDYLLMRDVRRDIFARGAIPISDTLFQETASQIEVVPLRSASDFQKEGNIIGANIKFDEERVQSVAKVLAGGPKTLSELITEMAKEGGNPSAGAGAVFRDIIVMNVIGNTTLRLVRSDRDAIQSRCQALNDVFKHHYTAEPTVHLALSETERACALNQLDMLFLQANGKDNPIEEVFRVASQRGMRLRNDKQEEISSLDQFQSILGEHAQSFYKDRLPALEREGLA